MSVIENALEKIRHAARAAVLTAEPPCAAKRISIEPSQLRAAGYLPEEGEERRFADYYRAIKRPLIQKALTIDGAAELRLILVSSALPGEGKTFTTLNLALSMAREHDISVLLVDADVPKAHISRAFGVESEPGLIDALRNESCDVDSLVFRTNVPGLDMLPSGGSVEGATELIASARMARVAAQLSQRNPRRLILFDSSPVLVSSEARALLHIPGQIVLVARSGQTPTRALLDAIALMDKKKISGLVLNDAATAASGAYHHYDYYSADKTVK